jgi:hypothetical protein
MNTRPRGIGTCDERPLAAGNEAVASHASAAWLWGLIDQPPDKPEVTVSWPRQHGRHVKGIRLHQSKDILDRAVTVRRTIRVTNPIRTLVDLGASVSLEQLADAIDRAVARKPVSIAALLADATTTAATPSPCRVG